MVNFCESYKLSFKQWYKFHVLLHYFFMIFLTLVFFKLFLLHLSSILNHFIYEKEIFRFLASDDMRGHEIQCTKK